MICKLCADAGRMNRKLSDLAIETQKSPGSFMKHPKNCSCACMHKPPQQWEKMFGVERPNGQGNN